MERINNFEWFKAERKAANETSDCVVVAIATAFQISYEEARMFCRKSLKRIDRRGVKHFRSMKLDQYMPFGACRRTRYKEAGKRFNITVGRFCKENPTGRHILMVDGHCLAVIDGVCHDHTDKPRRHVEVAFEVTGDIFRRGLTSSRRAA